MCAEAKRKDGVAGNCTTGFLEALSPRREYVDCDACLRKVEQEKQQEQRS